MDFYFAPMEGITGYLYRNAYASCFGQIDKYFTPFIMPNQNKSMNSKELRDVSPENNRGLHIIPQIMTNRSGDFIKTAEKLKALGYAEVNLNLGCPSRTVISKGRGAGFLAETEALDRFLYEIFEKEEISISIKTRIGKDSPQEFFALMNIYNKYKMKELIIHPRIQRDFYNNMPNWEVYREAAARSRNPLCYNGDIFTKKDYDRVRETFPQTHCVMLGRGILRNPGLIVNLREGTPLKKEQLRQFHDCIYQSYRQVLFGEKTVLFKMKELWSYMITCFADSYKYGKKIKKAERLSVYEEAVDCLFGERKIAEEED